ncbi:MAG: sulfotransferase domain-containing protein [Planctomycetota bacterium]
MSSTPAHRRPDFLLIGAMKAGTTSLFHDLNAQAGVFIPADKEPTTLVHRKDDHEALAEYDKLFAPAQPGDLLGDASTGYAKLPEVDPGLAERAARLCAPGAKILYLVRNPVDRMLSHYHHDLSGGLYDGPLGSGLREIPHILEFSLYGYQLEPWIKAFGPERVHVVHFRRYTRERAAVVEEVCRFLGVAYDPAKATEEVHNRSDGKPLMKGAYRWFQFMGIYRYLIRPLIPPRLRIKLTSILIPQAPPRPKKMPRESFEEIRPRLEEDSRRMSEQLGWPMPVFDLTKSVDQPDENPG